MIMAGSILRFGRTVCEFFFSVVIFLYTVEGEVSKLNTPLSNILYIFSDFFDFLEKSCQVLIHMQEMT